MSWGLLFDATRCIGCGACSAACKEQNQLPLPIEARTTAYTWTVVERRDGVNVRRMCMHCLTPTCVSVCPVAAMTKDPSGPAVYDAEVHRLPLLHPSLPVRRRSINGIARCTWSAST
jgi:formate dehydrogenase iron-sulfur subunit